jgi:hypothetical protein
VTDSIENESATAPKTPPASIAAPAQSTTPPPETKVI